MHSAGWGSRDVVVDDGRIVFWDAGCARRVDRTFIEDRKKLIGLRTRSATGSTSTQLRSTMNNVRASYAHKVDRDWLLGCVEPFWRRLFTAGPFHFTPPADCRETIAASPADVTRKINSPPDHVLLNRITFGVKAMMAALDARESWHALGRPHFYACAKAPSAATEHPPPVSSAPPK